MADKKYDPDAPPEDPKLFVEWAKATAHEHLRRRMEDEPFGMEVYSQEEYEELSRAGYFQTLVDPDAPVSDLNDYDHLKRKPTSMSTKAYELRWAEICRALRATGQMKDFSKGECFRVNRLLKEQIEKGNVEHVARGRYRLTVEDEGSVDEEAL